MPKPVATYSPLDVSIIAAGQVIEGYADDSFVEVKRDSDAWEKMVGADGLVARAKKLDRSGTVTITLLHTSPSNDVLSALCVADELSDAGLFPIAVKDGKGNTLCFGLEAWVTKPADVSFGNAVGTRQWVIAVADLDMVVGGSY